MFTVDGGEEEDGHGADDGQSGGCRHRRVRTESDAQMLLQDQGPVPGWSWTCRSQDTSVHSDGSQRHVTPRGRSLTLKPQQVSPEVQFLCPGTEVPDQHTIGA